MNNKRAAAVALFIMAALAGCGQSDGPGSMTESGTMGGGTSEGAPETLNQIELSTGNSADVTVH